MASSENPPSYANNDMSSYNNNNNNAASSDPQGTEALTTQPLLPNANIRILDVLGPSPTNFDHHHSAGGSSTSTSSSSFPKITIKDIFYPNYANPSARGGSNTSMSGPGTGTSRLPTIQGALSPAQRRGGTRGRDDQ